jgi:hypothetical protein
MTNGIIFTLQSSNFPVLCSNITYSFAYGVLCVWWLAKQCKLLTNKLMLQGYKESLWKWSFCKIYGRYNDLICICISSLAHMLIRLSFPYLLWGRVNSVYHRLRARGGCGWSAYDAYSPYPPDPTFAFVQGPFCLWLDFLFAFWNLIVFDTWLSLLFCSFWYLGFGFSLPSWYKIAELTMCKT